MGVSLVIHLRNPYVRTDHAHERAFFHRDAKTWRRSGGSAAWISRLLWFRWDAIHWHTQAQLSMHRFGAAVLPALQEAMRRYFFLKHRNGRAALAALSSDDFSELGFDSFALMRSVGEHPCPVPAGSHVAL